MGIAGHVSKKMLDHYSHIRLKARRTALDALVMKPELKANLPGTAAGYDTIDDTNSRRELNGMPQVVDLLMELSGIEPLASSLRNKKPGRICFDDEIRYPIGKADVKRC